MTERAFADLSRDSQYVFRAVLSALSEPGRVIVIDPPCSPPTHFDPAAAAVILALCDMDTPLWLDASHAVAESFFRFHTGATIVSDPTAARFLVADPHRFPALDTLYSGSAERPDESATLVIPVEDLDGCHGWRLSGPGIDIVNRLHVSGLDGSFSRAWATNHRSFPCGIDVIFTARGKIAGLPRSTRLEA